MNKVFAVFDATRDFKNFRNALLLMKRNGKSIDEALEFLNDHRELKLKKTTKKCDQCDIGIKTLTPYLEDGRDHSLWICNKCQHSEYIEKSIFEVKRELRNEQ